ncbi:MAG TPA: arginine deiminase-related protein [Nocardioides sp.]|nr:arginine deiminase-related protein [Nocardioides sp.]
MDKTLEWGNQYVMVRPDHFRVDYRINPFMDLAVQPDQALAREQWDTLVATIRSLGGDVDVVGQREDAPDMVFAMNLGLGLVRPDGRSHVVMSHMRHPQRRMETVTAQPWFAGRGFTTSYVGREGVGAHFEAGDAFAFGDALVVGYGPRTEELALKHLAGDLGVRVRGLRIAHPGMYHLDLAFCPLDGTRAIVCPAAFDEESADALMALVPDPIVLTEEEALTTFAANSIVIGRTVVMPGCPDRVRAELEAAGFEVLIVDVSEFHKGGGSIRCLTNPVDVRIGRDLPEVEGGAVVVPPMGLPLAG